jgi:hypothetical protein
MLSDREVAWLLDRLAMARLRQTLDQIREDVRL